MMESSRFAPPEPVDALLGTGGFLAETWCEGPEVLILCVDISSR
jgi:hypothetical protein